MLIGYLSSRARKFKRGKKLFIVCLSDRAGKFKRRANKKIWLLFVYPAGPESLKERQKVVYCLFIWQGRKIKRGKQLFIVCLSGRAGKFLRGRKMLIGYLSGRARKFKRKAKSCLLFVYPAGQGS